MSELNTPMKLMNMALAGLDDAGERAAACHLQRAIDALNRIPAMQPDDILESELIDRMLNLGHTPR